MGNSVMNAVSSLCPELWPGLGSKVSSSKFNPAPPIGSLAGSHSSSLPVPEDDVADGFWFDGQHVVGISPFRVLSIDLDQRSFISRVILATLGHS